ncbi:MAG: hypothetical protein OXD29_05265 [Roseovarius sp.]|nr:hypothetical protein [Roseovarius sp.]MCY4207346.1 hypothetical protein [Roseovarius sp.]MCY4291663.1 hypothetical protein [Roseovarius sp.]MCY4316127.1 hypothetical protein [Roseovarius sp.]
MSDKEDNSISDRRAYRRRRMADASRLMPLFGAALFGMPLLWGGETVPTTKVMVYVFAVWIALVVLSGLISRSLPDPSEERQRNQFRL